MFLSVLEVGKESACSVRDTGDMGSIPESWRSLGQGIVVTHSSIHEKSHGEPQSKGLQRVRNNWAVKHRLECPHQLNESAGTRQSFSYLITLYTCPPPIFKHPVASTWKCLSFTHCWVRAEINLQIVQISVWCQYSRRPLLLPCLGPLMKTSSIFHQHKSHQNFTFILVFVFPTRLCSPPGRKYLFVQGYFFTTKNTFERLNKYLLGDLKMSSCLGTHVHMWWIHVNVRKETNTVL